MIAFSFFLSEVPHTCRLWYLAFVWRGRTLCRCCQGISDSQAGHSDDTALWPRSENKKKSLDRQFIYRRLQISGCEMYHGCPNWEPGGSQVIGCLMFFHAKKHCHTVQKKLGNVQNNIPQLSPTYGVCVCVCVCVCMCVMGATWKKNNPHQQLKRQTNEGLFWR